VAVELAQFFCSFDMIFLFLKEFWSRCLFFSVQGAQFGDTRLTIQFVGLFLLVTEIAFPGSFGTGSVNFV